MPPSAQAVLLANDSVACPFLFATDMVGTSLHLCTKGGGATYGTRANVSDLPTLHHVVQCFHDLFPRHVAVEPMDLQHINIRPQPSYACIDSIEDMLSRKTDLINPWSIIGPNLGEAGLGSAFAHAKVAFAQEDDFGARDLELAKSFSNNLLRPAIRINIGLLKDLHQLRELEDQWTDSATVSQVFNPTL